MTWHPLSDCFDPSALPPKDPQHRALGWVRQAWGSLAGALPAGAVVPSRISREGVLTLTVADEAMKSRVRAEKAELLKRLHAFLGPQVVTGLRWEIGPCPAPPIRPPVPQPPQLPPGAESAADAIADPALRGLFMAACRALREGGGPQRG